ncbi:MAG: DUF1318 domain-containing protein [Candidatus Hydrogenedentes bacterium]|nr:DUF1318 domain-containing protein [Candidatus Hydrogenedentota bacterium]
MTTSKTAAAALCAALVCLACAGCASVSGTFFNPRVDYGDIPQEELASVAGAIEAGVRAGDRELTVENTSGIVVDAPEVVQAIHTRAARAELVDKLLSSGHACEQRNGVITLLRTRDYKKSTTSQDRDRNALVVMSENANRWTIYEGIQKASNLKAKSLGAIQDSFYQARVALLTPGQKYEGPNGEMLTK